MCPRHVRRTANSPAWTDPTGSYTATLDKFDRPTAVNDPVNASDFTWTYRADGQSASFGQPNGNTTAYAYDALGRLTSKDTTAGAIDRALYDWTHNRAGQILTEAASGHEKVPTHGHQEVPTPRLN